MPSGVFQEGRHVDDPGLQHHWQCPLYSLYFRNGHALHCQLLDYGPGTDITGWLGIAYFIRTQVIIIRDREYNLASRCLGTSTVKIAMKNILPFMTSVIVTYVAAEIPLYISMEVFLAYIGLGMSEMSLGRLIFEAESAMATPGWGFEFWSPVVISAVITVVLYVVGQNLGDASDPRTHM